MTTSQATNLAHAVQGIGGVFLYANDAPALAAWYARHLGIETTAYGGSHFREYPSADLTPAGRQSTTTFAIFQADEPLPAGVKTARVNYRVADLDATTRALEAAGVATEREADETYGRFAYAHDPEGNKIELWEPPSAS